MTRDSFNYLSPHQVQLINDIRDTVADKRKRGSKPAGNEAIYRIATNVPLQNGKENHDDN